MAWKVEFTEASRKDFESLDGSVKPIVIKALKKVSQNPLPVQEGGYGKSLGNKGGKGLAGLYKIKLLRQGIRIVYGLKRIETAMTIVVIALRSDNHAYDLAEERRTEITNLDM